jgi:hypothetical protein
VHDSLHLEQARHVRGRWRLVSRRAGIVVGGVTLTNPCALFVSLVTLRCFGIRNQACETASRFETRQLLGLWQLCIASVVSMQASVYCLSKAVILTASRDVPGGGVDGPSQPQVQLAAWSEPVRLGVGCLQFALKN